MEQFNIPVVLFMFLRSDTVLRIIERIRAVKPLKLYLLSDEGRTEDEKQRVRSTRAIVEEAIDWPCEVIKNYAYENRGVHANIGLGAKWVFEREEEAIFLEDDNLPEVSFFEYCKELLQKYKDDKRILWICGTNYLGQYEPQNGASYMFTQHLLPCGWASWAKKFNQFYDDKLLLVDDDYIIRNIGATYKDKRLYQQQIDSVYREKKRKDAGLRFASWDYHMALSVRAHSMLGISPSKNQIRNIGVDADSIHGGTNFGNIMTQRFCGMDSYPLEMPLKHPKTVLIDEQYEKRISDIILMPLHYRAKVKISKKMKKLLNIPEEQSLVKTIFGK